MNLASKGEEYEHPEYIIRSEPMPSYNAYYLVMDHPLLSNTEESLKGIVTGAMK